MQALALMVIYVLTTAMVQFIGFLISRLVDYQYPTLGLMTFLCLFMGAFWLAWPLAIRITEWLIRRAGYEVETEQSGLEGRQEEATEHRGKNGGASSARREINSELNYFAAHSGLPRRSNRQVRLVSLIPAIRACEVRWCGIPIPVPAQTPKPLRSRRF